MKANTNVETLAQDAVNETPVAGSPATQAPKKHINIYVIEVCALFFLISVGLLAIVYMQQNAPAPAPVPTAQEIVVPEIVPVEENPMPAEITDQEAALLDDADLIDMELGNLDVVEGTLTDEGYEETELSDLDLE